MTLQGKGFSLLELLIAIAIMGVLLSLGLPALSTYSRNIKLRAAAESFFAGLQLARGEAVRLNASVELILANAAPAVDDGSDGDYPVLAEESRDNLDNLVASGKLAANHPVAHVSTSGDPSYNWLVRTKPAAGGECGANPDREQAKACWFLAGKRGAEGAGGSGADAESRILIEGPASVWFSPLGGANAKSDFFFSSPGEECAKPPPDKGGPIHCLRVRVELGGRVKLCDPAATAGDTRAC
ncbi:hypothetical protein ACCAA_440044 [Candidatus Accumulibacter aalborgensis]|uniref:Type II secretion system protein H n=1 Tax=Candidatus Accumulibacter aalborgensis TaxID=1860102 RepID=A0A1A8XSQ6_9PROT|nr:prepilin-type N-terminal cleavage/methylation domain-containing protein [Candidatus Accumulibacter aalborgensis]SBT07542.1 hypothetical protein ACCAA_440044 [Candidatus Accumulibacter aalborgensis]